MPELTNEERKLLAAAERQDRGGNRVLVLLLIGGFVAGLFKILDSLGVATDKALDFSGIASGVLLWLVFGLTYIAIRQRQIAISLVRKLRESSSPPA